MSFLRFPGTGVESGVFYCTCLIRFGRRAAVIGIAHEPGATAFDQTIKVDLLHVAGIEELPGVSPSKNGPAG